MTRRILRTAGVAIGAVVLVLGVEIVLAVNRRYLPTAPALGLDAAFGPLGGERLRFVVLGDSTGAGVGAGSAAEAFPTLLAERLAADGRRVELRVLAVSGARVRDVAETQVPAAADARPDLVFVAIGGNDATHLTGLGGLRRDIERALDDLIATGAVVVVSGPGDMRAHNFLPPLRQVVGWRGRRVEAVIREAAGERGIPVVALRERTGELFSDSPGTFFSEDDFHPGPAGYAAWAKAIFPVLDAALEAGR
ncbi:MAG: SGNH/GDSL hydrolase family protein [Actinomycetota bacterium]